MLSYNRVGRGTYWRAFGFAKELVGLGYSVTLMAVSRSRNRQITESITAGVHVVETPDLHPSSGYDPVDVFLRTRWLRQQTYDLIHAFESRPVVIGPARSLQKRLGIPLVIDWCDWFGRGGSVEERANPLLRTILRPIETYFEEAFRPEAAGNTVINTLLRQKAVKLGIPTQKILLLPNGANVDGIRPVNKATIRKQLGLPVDKPILVYTGAIFQQDAFLMAETFNRIHLERPDVHLLLVGYKNISIESMVDAKTAVIRTGPVSYPKLASYIAAADIGWLPLVNNGANQGRFPMKASDYMAAGLPIITTDIGDLGKLVSDNQIGWVSKDTPHDMADVILNILNNPDAIRLKGKQARLLAETEFTWSLLAQKLSDFYQLIVS